MTDALDYDFAGATQNLLTVIGLVVIGAFVGLRLFARLRRGTTATVDRRLSVVDRLPLQPRAAIYIVRCDAREFLVLASDHGLRRLTELPATPAEVSP